MSQPLALLGRTVLLTGANGGLGRVFARALAAQGAELIVATRKADAAAKLSAELAERGHKVRTMTFDLIDVEAVRIAFQKLEQEIDCLHAVVNNAGIYLPGAADQVDELQYDALFATNVKGAFFVAQAAFRLMRRRGEQCGRIVNIASTTGLRAVPKSLVYGMTKAALIHLTRSLATEWAASGVTVNAICPGYIATETNLGYWRSEAGERRRMALPRRRTGTADQLCSLLVYLCSEESDLMTGAVIPVDDGLSVA